MSPYTWGSGDRRRIKLEDFPREVLALIDARQGGRHCVACKAADLATPEDEPLELDHKQPLSRGGDNQHQNLQWLCRSHNRGRGNRRDVPQEPRWLRRRRRGRSS